MPSTNPRTTLTTTTSRTAAGASAASLLLLVAAVAIGMAGCGSGARVEVAPSHPASPDAEPAPVPPRSNTLEATSTDAPQSGAAAHPPSATAPSGSAATYVCPMHPEVVQDRPGECPKCGMSLLLKDKP